MKGPLSWWRERRLQRARSRVSAEIWEALWASLPLLEGLGAEDSARLRDLALLFLHEKAVEPARGLQLDGDMRLYLALQACLPVLNLGLGWYRGWYSMIVYPEEFVPAREWVDEDGLVWVDDEAKSGEAWEQGPVILSWADVQAGAVRDGFNVVVHELAHKLDMRNGAANGHPPLHAGMSDTLWARAFSRAYRDLTRRADRGEHTPIDPYGAESPAEFFAVVSEAFFELPHLLADEYPPVYGLLRDFYRQDPLARLAPVAMTARVGVQGAGAGPATR